MDMTEYTQAIAAAAHKCEVEFSETGYTDADAIFDSCVIDIAKSFNSFRSCVKADLDNYISEGCIL